MLWSTILALSACTFSSATPLASDAFQVKHSWASVPAGWSLERAAPPDHILDLRIGLKEGNIDAVIENLDAVSDPANARYGQHLSKAKVDALVAPKPETVSAVNAWLATAGVDLASVRRSTAGDWLRLSVPVSRAEAMLRAKYGVFKHAASGALAVRTLAWSLPRSVHGHIDLVEPTTFFARPQIPLQVTPSSARGALAVPPDSCNTVITPACLRTLYNTANYTPTATRRNSLGVAGYLDEFANRADLQTFFTQFRPDAVGSSFTTVQLNGGGDDQTDPGVEANLDIQYTTGISFPTPNIYYSTGGSPPFNPDDSTPTNTNEPYLDWLAFILDQPHIPQTFTTSYGDDEQTVPKDYAIRACNSFAQLGVRGSSLMFSSGDFGVGAGDCLTNDGTNTLRFQPAFPASCPFVTTVGGTIHIAPEIAVDFSGGGFSNYFARPRYQNDAVSGFLRRLGQTNAGLFNTTGRGYPDVAAQGLGFQVVIGGTVGSVGGTSASSPTFAAVISLLNDARLARGKPSLGFLNPLIYAQPGGLNDITAGNNPGCGTDGFTAGKGWDPVTGLGTPDFKKLRRLFG